MDKIWVKCTELGGSMHVGEQTITGYFPAQVPKTPAVMEAIGMGRLKEFSEAEADEDLKKAKANVATMTTAAETVNDATAAAKKEADDKAKKEADDKAKKA